jgi:dihydropyrimidinase
MDNRAFDLVIRGATVVTERGRDRADVGVLGEHVGRIGGPMRAVREIDAAGLFVLPGGVDPHVHLTTGPELPDQVDEVGWIDDFTSGSAAALAGGITTLGNMTFSGGSETMREAIAREAALARTKAIADVFLHPVWPGPRPSNEADVRHLCDEGYRSLKLFTCLPEFDSHAAAVVRAVQAARAGQALTLIHCEDAAVIDCCTRGLVQDGRHGFEHFPLSRPPLAEVVAVQRAVALCELTGAATYVVHLSCARALQVCREARARGLPLFVETRPLYLHLTEDRYSGAQPQLYVGQPPLRGADDREALWGALADGSIHTIGSDHAPWRSADKLAPEHTIDKLRPGVPELGTMLPMLISEGVGRRGLSLERVVALTAANPARLFGLYPRKGTIAPGSDADLVLWDMQRKRPVRAAQLHSRSDYSPYEDTEVTGWPVMTIRRGEVVFEEGRILGAPGSGHVLARGPTQAV